MAKSRKAGQGDVKTHTAKALSGKHASKGASFDPNQITAAAAAAAAGPIIQRARPSKSRYPIDIKTYDLLKDEAVSKVRPLASPKSELVIDKPKKGELASSAPAALALSSSALALASSTPASAPSAVSNFEGISATGWLPPDCTAAAGPSHVLVSVNATVAVYAKAGGAPLLLRTHSAWYSNVITAAKIFDPKVVYDQNSGRWILLTVALPNDTADHSSWYLLSVSKTADPLGGWFNYKLDAKVDGATATDNWADYPSLGVDNQCIFLTSNMFKFGGNFQYAKIRVIPKAAAYAGTALKWFDYTKLKNGDGSSCFTIQPCHTFGAPGTQFFLNSLFPNAGARTQNDITLWSLPNPVAGGSISSRTIAVNPYGMPPDAEQKGGSPPLNTGDVRVLNAIFRAGSVWAAFTTSHDWGDGQGVAATQWVELNATSGAVTQQGIFGAKGFHYFYPAVMPDTNGNMTMVFCRSGATLFASISYTGRHSTDAPGSLQGSALLKAGLGHYSGVDGSGRNRWGDYSGIAVDPTDGRTVWFYSMFATSTNAWGTWIGSARF